MVSPGSWSPPPRLCLQLPAGHRGQRPFNGVTAKTVCNIYLCLLMLICAYLAEKLVVVLGYQQQTTALWMSLLLQLKENTNMLSVLIKSHKKTLLLSGSVGLLEPSRGVKIRLDIGGQNDWSNNSILSTLSGRSIGVPKKELLVWIKISHTIKSGVNSEFVRGVIQLYFHGQW